MPFADQEAEKILEENKAHPIVRAMLLVDVRTRYQADPVTSHVGAYDVETLDRVLPKELGPGDPHIRICEAWATRSMLASLTAGETELERLAAAVSQALVVGYLVAKDEGMDWDDFPEDGPPVPPG